MMNIKNMRKIGFNIKLILLALCFFMLLTACGGGAAAEENITSGGMGSDGTGSDGIGSDGIDSDGTGSDGAGSDGAKDDPTKPKDVKVAFIYNGTIAENSFNAAFENARFEIMKLTGVSTGYMENVLVQQFDEAVEKFKDAGYNVIVAASNHFAAACADAAKNNSDGTYFISYGNLKSQSKMSSFAPLLYQPAAVTGLVAAYNTVSNKIGMVVDNNAFHAHGVADAFVQGTKELDGTDLEINLNWALSNSNAETKRAIDDLTAKGCDVIFLYQTSIYGILYCEQIGVKVIGHAYNMPELAPNYFLTGYYSIPKNYVIENVRGAQYNNFKSLVINQGLLYGYTGMTVLNETLCKEGTDLLTDKYYNYVLEGKATVFQGEIRDSEDVIRVDKGAWLAVPQILDINWLTKDIDSETNFSEPRSEDDLIFSNLIIVE